jgi:hypothetical protein
VLSRYDSVLGFHDALALPMLLDYKNETRQ